MVKISEIIYYDDISYINISYLNKSYYLKRSLFIALISGKEYIFLGCLDNFIINTIQFGTFNNSTTNSLLFRVPVSEIVRLQSFQNFEQLFKLLIVKNN